MVTTRKAVPTEYNGVRFDSKSEAVFARAMDLAGIRWLAKHPIRHQGHDWDFLIYYESHDVELLGDDPLLQPDGDLCSNTEHVLLRNTKTALIELKPSRPTDSYIEKLRRTIRNDGILRLVVYGSPWERNDKHWYGPLFYQFLRVTRDASSHLPLGVISPCVMEITRLDKLDSFVDEARSFRFDLDGRW